MKLFAAAFFSLVISFNAINSVAQVAIPSQGQPPPYGDYVYHLPGLDEPRYNSPFARFRPTPESRVLKKGPLAPALEDRTAYAGFLKQKGTGLVRLWARPTPNEKSTNRPGSAWYGEHYSFFFLSHVYGADLTLTFDVVCHGAVAGSPQCQYPRKLSAGIYGVLTNLGDVALDEITAKDSRAAFLVAYEPPREGPKVRCEWLEFGKGVTSNGQLYKTALPIEVNSTYLLRSTDHRRSDVLVAFRVIREDVDGSVTLAWKLLKEFTPRSIKNGFYVNGTNKCLEG